VSNASAAMMQLYACHLCDAVAVIRCAVAAIPSAVQDDRATFTDALNCRSSKIKSLRIA